MHLAPAGQGAQDAAGGQDQQQQLYQQHLAQWQAAFQEYWKCSAGMQQQGWQAMMGGGYGAMPFYGGGMMNPYAGMMGAAPTAAAAPQPQGSMSAGMGMDAAVPAAAAPQATTATTATSSQAGLSKANGMESDADSRLTTESQDDMPSSAPLSLAASGPSTSSAAAQPAPAPAAPAAAPPADTAPVVAADASRAPAAAAGGATANPAAPVPVPAAVLVPAPGATTGAAAPQTVGLQMAGLSQPATLAVSQAAVQMSGLGDSGGSDHGGMSHSMQALQHHHHVPGLPLFGDDGQPVEEKDLKRLRRKQSNRESARRSRLRKQAENDTLQQRLHDCEAQRNSLLAENALLKQRIALMMQVRGLGGQVVAPEVEANPIATISAYTAGALQQHMAAAAAAAVAASQAMVVPAAAVAAPTATLASVQQVHGMAVVAPQPVVPASTAGKNAGGLVHTGILSPA